jgi:chemotaxis protein methyltransferase CheR
MTDQDFEFIRKLMRERSGIELEAGKEYLVEARLTPVVRKLSLGSISDLVGQARLQGANGLQTAILEAMVTTETSFFRDHQPFEALERVVLPDLMARRREERRLTIWCGACSTGQEPYSLAIVIREHFPELLNWDVSILATDLSATALERARTACYSQIEVNRGLPANLLCKYFRQTGTHWQLAPELRAMVRFEELNLARQWPPLSKMDLILMRNVMIYFDTSAKKEILARLKRLLRPDGYLLLGGAETTFNLNDSFQRLARLKAPFYQLVS